MRPAPRLLALAGLWLAGALAAALWPGYQTLWAGAGLALAALAALDAWQGSRQAAPAADRRVPGTLALGIWREVGLRMTNSGRQALALQVFDRYPAQAESSRLPQRLSLAPGTWGELRYGLRPTERGSQRFGRLEALVTSPLGLWHERRLLGEESPVRVYPNFGAVAKYALLATDNRLSQMGIRMRRRRGAGMEFHQLREYRPGDSLRQIDWKATSRQAKLISREYQDERDQQVFFLVDCGRRMLAKDGELSHFDHSLNSVLLLAHVALRQGDAVGLMTFSGEPRFVPPLKGAETLNTLLDAVYDLQPGAGSPDYSVAATELMKRLKKRSLVVVVTNLRDEDASDVLPALKLLRRRHLVLLASLRERIIGDVLKQPVEKFSDALRAAATHQYLLARRKVHDAIRQYGALSLDVEPEQLPVAMVNRYLDIKRSGKL
ncbi:MAG: DUF58 domain-containing protein [Betaproteobacteria bacterium]|nr:DUF58 domain-containing protein [Betaproteobacteria bacterium]